MTATAYNLKKLLKFTQSHLETMAGVAMASNPGLKALLFGFFSILFNVKTQKEKEWAIL